MRASRLRPLPHVDFCAELFEFASLVVVFALFLVEIAARALINTLFALSGRTLGLHAQ